MIKFPITNISTREWTGEEDPMEFILERPFIYTADEDLYFKYYYDQKFVDSHGVIYKVVSRRLPKSKFRRVFRFLPNVYRVELIFLETKDERFTLDQFRAFIIKKINLYTKGRDVEEWLTHVRKATTFKEIMGF